MRKKIKRYLVISDLQVPFHHEVAVKNVIKLARREKFDSVLVVGDEIDFNTISKWAEGTPLAYRQTIHDDRELTKSILWDLSEYSRECHIIRSNHTDRLYNTLLKVPDPPGSYPRPPVPSACRVSSPRASEPGLHVLVVTREGTPLVHLCNQPPFHNF